MQTDTRVTSLAHVTAGTWTHTGRLVVQFMGEDGVLMKVTLPDDLVALQARMAALEARQPPEA